MNKERKKHLQQKENLVSCIMGNIGSSLTCIETTNHNISAILTILSQLSVSLVCIHITQLWKTICLQF